MSTGNRDCEPVTPGVIEIPGDEIANLINASVNFHLYLKARLGPSADWAVWVRAESPEEFQMFEEQLQRFQSASEAVRKRVVGSEPPR